jgi:hypothetical protein
VTPRGVVLKDLREVNFSTIGLLSMGRSNQAWLIFLMSVPSKAMASHYNNSKL